MPEKKEDTQGADSSSKDGRWARWGRQGYDKSIKVSDWISPYANAISAKVGGERFWPQSHDMPLEIEKCERILRAFTVEGIVQKDSKEEQVQDGKGNWMKKKVRVMRKIPPAAIRNAKGICIFSSMRSGFAPFGGGGGSGVFMARLPDGSWSAPSAVTPQNASAGLLLGIDFLDCILLINSEKALESFKSHRIDIGAETGLTAGPYGSGLSAEAGLDKAPIYSYVRTRGAYAGVELMGQIFFHRFDENERFYYWPGITAKDILSGKVRIPPSVFPIHRALRDAETGRAQGGKLERTEYDLIKMPESEATKQLGPHATRSRKRFVAGMPISSSSSPQADTSQLTSHSSLESLNVEGSPLPGEEKEKRADDHVEESEDEDFVQDGERLRLPPTPAELEMMEAAGIPDDEDLRVALQDREKIYQLPPPPMHTRVKHHWSTHPTLGSRRPTEQLVMDGPHSPEVRQAQYVKLPPSPSPSLENDMSIQDVPETPAETIEDGKNDTHFSTEEEEVLLQGATEEDVDRVMAAAVKGEDVGDKSKAEMFTTNEEQDADQGAEQSNNITLGQHAKQDHDDATEALEDASERNESTLHLEEQNQTDDHANSAENEAKELTSETEAKEQSQETDEQMHENVTSKQETSKIQEEQDVFQSEGSTTVSRSASPAPSIGTPPKRPPRRKRGQKDKQKNP